MGTITTEAGVEIFYKDWGKGQPIVFSHGWPLQRRLGHADAVLPEQGLSRGALKSYKNYPHGMITTQAEIINADLLAFLQS